MKTKLFLLVGAAKLLTGEKTKLFPLVGADKLQTGEKTKLFLLVGAAKLLTGKNTKLFLLVGAAKLLTVTKLYLQLCQVFLLHHVVLNSLLVVMEDRILNLLVLNSEHIMHITKGRSMCEMRGVETCERVSSIPIFKLF